MLASKSHEDSQQFDTFSCAECKTVLTLVPPGKEREPER
jgi:hypothetical protein